MHPKVHEFLTKNRLCVLSIIDEMGNPYSATVFYAYQDKSPVFYFLSDKHTRKVKELIQGKTQRTSIVIGFTEGEWKSYQAVGITSMIQGSEELMRAEAVYYLKYPHAQTLAEDRNLMFFAFTPLHWKFTDLNPNTWEVAHSEEG